VSPTFLLSHLSLRRGLQTFSSLNDPLPFVKRFFEAYPLAAEQLLAAEDTAYFLAILQRPGQKPVPFIPVLDASFEVWFKKVSSDMRKFHALTNSPTVVQGASYVDNALRRILVPRAGQKVVVKSAGTLPLSVAVYGAARSYGEHMPTFKALSIVFNPETKLIDLTLFEERQDVAVPLSLQFQYCPSQEFAPIHEIASGRNERFKQFYLKLWFGDSEVLPNIDIHENFVGPDAAINFSDVEQFCAVAGNLGVKLENPSRLRGTTTSRRLWILPSLLAGR
jgi:enoyl reductase-like protein